MLTIFCPQQRRRALILQELHCARAIARNITAHSPASIAAACRSIIKHSPHRYEARCARDVLTSMNRRAA